MQRSCFTVDDERIVRRFIIAAIVGWAVACFAVGFAIGVLQ